MNDYNDITQFIGWVLTIIFGVAIGWLLRMTADLIRAHKNQLRTSAKLKANPVICRCALCQDTVGL